MLKLSLKQGEYITIGGDVVVQYDRTLSDRCRLMITAPRDVPILRGAVLERNGEDRPDCVVGVNHDRGQSIPWNSGKSDALLKIRDTLNAVEKRDSRVTGAKRLLDSLFPAEMLREMDGDSDVAAQ